MKLSKKRRQRTGLATITPQRTGSIKFSISMPAALAANSVRRQGELQLSTFSDYLQHAARKEQGI